MANYALSNSTAGMGVGTAQSLTTSYKTLVRMNAGATARRGKLYDLLLGTTGTPGDTALEWDISRTTSGNTAGDTATTPNPLDPADAAALTSCGTNTTTEITPTANSSIFYLAINQRASYRWVAAPGSELVWPATTSSGIILRARSASYTSTAGAQTYFQEQ